VACPETVHVPVTSVEIGEAVALLIHPRQSHANCREKFLVVEWLVEKRRGTRT
jgi:hypothetical protein